jgi:hypothetical protein
MPFGAGAVWPTGQGRPRACSPSAVAGKIAGMKRKWLWLLALAIPVIIGAGYVLVPLKESRISQVNCDKIQEGWSEKQVEDLLGSCTFHDMPVINPCLVSKIWSDDDGNLIGVFFDNGSVYGKDFAASDLSFWEKMKGRIQSRLRALWP